MSLEAPLRCSAVAEELDEPMIGTLDAATRWLLVEDRSAWGQHAVRDVLGQDLARDLKAAAVRALLIRRREGDPQGDTVRRVILVDTGLATMAVRTVTDPRELAVKDVARAPVAEFGARLAGPMFMVCTNGKRDACCAVRGRALITALAHDHAERTWECSHLGGHRFAANLVCLPDGIVYGRVSASDGPRLLDAYLERRLDPLMLRGRSAWPAPAQVADRHVRLERGLIGLDEVRLASCGVEGDSADVLLESAAGQLRVALRRERASPPRPTSCRGDELEEPDHWRVIA